MRTKASPSRKFYEGSIARTREQAAAERRLASSARKVCYDYTVTRHTLCKAVFYPYTTLKSTVKIDNGVTRIRVSDILMDAPGEVLEALSHILLSRAAGKKPPQNHVLLYHQFVHRPAIEKRHAELRALRSKKRIPGPKGKVYDLDQSFLRINERYFGNRLEMPVLTWSVRRSRRQLGYRDDHLDIICISRWLDRAAVPQYVLDYVMYHEMLHIVVPAKFENGRRVVHTPEFKRREREYGRYEDALRWIRRR